MANFVLVHGGMIGGNCWKDVRRILEQKQHAVLTPTLTGLGERKHLSHPNLNLETHIHDIVNAIVYEELDEVILVGHSYGGMVITGVADRIRNRIKKLIYIAAVLPKSGESMFDAVGPEISSCLTEAARQNNGWEVPAGAPQGYGIYAADIVEWFEQMSTPQSIKSFEQKLHLQNSSHSIVEKVYVKCAEDAVLDSMVVRAREMQIPCYEILSGHFPMLTAYGALADFLLLQAEKLIYLSCQSREKNN